MLRKCKGQGIVAETRRCGVYIDFEVCHRAHADGRSEAAVRGCGQRSQPVPYHQVFSLGAISATDTSSLKLAIEPPNLTSGTGSP